MSIEPAEFAILQGLVSRHAAIVLEPGKEYLAETRLGPLARGAGCASVTELLRKVDADPRSPIVGKVVEAMTTNETSFFRDIHPFEALRTTVVPELLKARAAERTLNLWCAAASSGQEPYSVAMTLLEHFPELRGWKVRFVASDIAPSMLARCREGRYSQLEVNRGLPAKLLVKYFDKHGPEWQLKPEVRSMIEFVEVNLSRPFPAWPPMDIVFMRNVLIYFSLETKRDIMRRVRRQLRPDGWFFLGGSESTLNVDDKWTRVQVEKTSIYRPAP
jgi:chemotaxis protein methyltransferase CheR